MDHIDRNERRRARYATDMVYRARRRAEAAAAYQLGRADRAKVLAKAYRLDETAIIDAAFVGSVCSPTGVMFRSERFLPPSTLARALGISHYTMGKWIQRGVWPAPMCAVVSAARADVYCLSEALTYARVFCDTVGTQPLARPFNTCPDLAHILERARQKVREALVERSRQP